MDYRINKLSQLLVIIIVISSILNFIACDKHSTKVPQLENIIFAEPAIWLHIGESQQLKIIFSPEKATPTRMIYTSSNESIVTISTDGLATALAEGEAIITASTKEGRKSTECRINVVSENTFIVANASQWHDTINQIKQDLEIQESTILLINDFSLAGSEDYTFGEKEELIITISGKHTIFLDLNTTGHLLKIGTKQKLTIDNVALKGHSYNTTSLVNIFNENISFINETLFIMTGQASIGENTAHYVGGGVRVLGGSVFMYDETKIDHNNIERFDISGGGIYLSLSYLTMSDHALITNNTAFDGGGCYLSSGKLTMSGFAAITENSSFYGGGCLNDQADILITDSAHISNNQASKQGGGICQLTNGYIFMIYMEGEASIYANYAQYGGGIYGVVKQSGNSTIHTNSSEYGGGVYGKAKLTDSSTMFNNSAQEGGGVYGSVELFDSSAISNNTAQEGGGLFINNTFMEGSLIMANNSKIHSNTAFNNGGGVNVQNQGQVIMQDEASIFKNTAYNGGGIFLINDSANGNQTSMFMSGGIIYGNQTMGNPPHLANEAHNEGAVLFRTPADLRGPKICYGSFYSDDDILPHTDDSPMFTDITVLGHEH